MAMQGWPYQWSFLGDFSRLQQEMEGILGKGALGWLGRESGYPPVNIFATAAELFVQAEVPGIAVQDAEVAIHRGALTLNGERPGECPAGEGRLRRRERRSGEFARVLRLPEPVDGDRASAAYRAGILTVRLPKREPAEAPPAARGGQEAQGGEDAVLPAVDICEEPEEIVLVADMPGVSEGAVEVTADDETLAIAGRPEAFEPENAGEWLREFRPKTYRRSFAISPDIHAEGIRGKIVDGVLRLRLPKTGDARARRIPVVPN